MTFATEHPKGKQISTKTVIDDEETSIAKGMLTIPLDARVVTANYAEMGIARCAGGRCSFSYCLALTIEL